MQNITGTPTCSGWLSCTRKGCRYLKFTRPFKTSQKALLQGTSNPCRSYLMLTSPSVRVVYSKLKSAGYPAEPAERAKVMSRLNIARWPSELSIPSSNGTLRQRRAAPSQPDPTVSRINQQTLTYPHAASLPFGQRGSKQEDFSSPSMPWTAGQPRLANGSGVNQSMGTEKLHENSLFSLPEEPTSSGFDTEDVASFQGHDNMPWEIGEAESFLDLAIEYPDETKSPSLFPSEVHRAVPEKCVQLETCSLVETAAVATEIRPDIHELYRPMPITTDYSPYLPDTTSPCTQRTPSPSTNFSRPSATSYFGGRLFPFRKPKARNNRCFTPEKRNSTATTDSGYASGRNSPFVLLPEGDHPHPRSLMEFKGLYRVPCPRLHEPQPYNEDYMPHPTERFKDTEKCLHCQYSGIHNLS